MSKLKLAAMFGFAAVATGAATYYMEANTAPPKAPPPAIAMPDVPAAPSPASLRQKAADAVSDYWSALAVEAQRMNPDITDRKKTKVANETYFHLQALMKDYHRDIYARGRTDAEKMDSTQAFKSRLDVAAAGMLAKEEGGLVALNPRLKGTIAKTSSDAQLAIDACASAPAAPDALAGGPPPKTARPPAFRPNAG